MIRSRSKRRFRPKKGFLPRTSVGRLEYEHQKSRGLSASSFWNQRQLFSMPPDSPGGGGPVTLWPMQRGITASLADPEIRTIIVMGPSQAGKTMLITFGLGFIIVDDPSATLMISADDKERNKFVNDKWKRVVVTNRQVLSRLKPPGKAGWSKHMITMSNGATLTFEISTREGAYRQTTAKYVFLDEPDIFNPPSGIEPMSAAEKRREQFYETSTLFAVSSPILRCQAGSAVNSICTTSVTGSSAV